jgi:predicted nucleotidyltransferase
VEHPIIAVAHAIRTDRYPGAAAVFAAGSIVRGEGTAHSDLDLVVVYDKLPSAYRESFRFDGYPVEAFVHDRETLEYFFVEVDRPSGIPTLPQMIVEGIEIPAPNDLSRALKERAVSLIAAGPPPLDAETEQRLRYAVTDLLDDLRDARAHDEVVGAGSQLYGQLADYHLRRHGLWSARGKAIPRTLRRVDPELCERYRRSFDRLFQFDEAGEVIRLAEELLRASGGLLFEGYRADAPPTWRRPAANRRDNSAHQGEDT